MQDAKVIAMTDLTERNLFENITGETTVKESQENRSGNKLRGVETDTRPTTSIDCPECEHDRAYYEMKQIRAADESETRFFQCTKCSHKWRENDH